MTEEVEVAAQPECHQNAILGPKVTKHLLWITKQ